MAYLGKKGYSILKSNLTTKEQQFIRDELTVKAYIPKSPVQPEPFSIYRESPNKFYVPRYFGVDTFGDFTENKIPPGDDIDIKFTGDLREYQINIVNKYINFVKDSGEVLYYENLNPITRKDNKSEIIKIILEF